LLDATWLRQNDEVGGIEMQQILSIGMKAASAAVFA
jgi:hypothetical protein